MCEFPEMVQKKVTSGNCLQFPEIPAKSRENFTGKSAISIDFQQIFLKNEKSTKSIEICKKSKKFAIEAVQKYVNFVDLEKCCKCIM